MESYIEVIIFRAVQEILGYVVRQGQANQISVQMDITEAHIKYHLDDNGKGIDVETIMEGAWHGDQSDQRQS